MEFKDYYKIMGVDPEATQDEIKRAYRKLARKYHPDVSKEKNAEALFKELGEAYEVLKDKEKRAQYDMLRKQGWRPGDDFHAPPHGTYRESHVNPEDMGAFSDFFESIFGHQARGGAWQHTRQRTAQMRGEDVSYVLEVTPKDSYTGASRQIEIPTTEIAANGQLIRKTRTINVKIPKGVVAGQHIRLRGQGQPGLGGGPHGDLYLEIRLKQQDPFHVAGKDVSIFLPVTPWEAALGAKVKIPTLDGVIELKVPHNSQSGTKLRLKGKGLPGNPPGDQYVQLQIFTPPVKSERDKELYEKIAEQMPFNPRAKLGV